jgi:PAS domain-containing protein
MSSSRQQPLKLSDEFLLQAMLGSMRSLVTYIDPSLTYRFCNEAFQNWFGLEADQIIGQKMSGLFINLI